MQNKQNSIDFIDAEKTRGSEKKENMRVAYGYIPHLAAQHKCPTTAAVQPQPYLPPEVSGKLTRDRTLSSPFQRCPCAFAGAGYLCEA